MFDSVQKYSSNTNSTYEGYIVTTNKDTLVGYIKMLSPIYNSIRVQFIHKKNEKLEVFKSEELLSYAFKVNNAFINMDSSVWVEYEKYYVDQPSIPFGTNEVLLYKAQSGTINLYHHFYENPSTPEEPIKVIFLIKTKEGKLIHLTRSNYQLVLQDLMINNPIIRNNIQKSKYRDIEHLVKQFNQSKEVVKAG